MKPLIINSIRRYYNNIQLYDDLIQEGYEIILEGVRNFDDTRGVYFLGYIKSLLKYHYLNKHREKYVISLNTPIGENEEELMDILESNEVDPLDNIIQTEEYKELRNSFSLLTERQRKVVVLFYSCRMPIGKIAEKLGISYRTVVNTKTAAIQKLKKSYKII
jgi:RNA polymerase sporulation-specific sigma factor